MYNIMEKILRYECGRSKYRRGGTHEETSDEFIYGTCYLPLDDANGVICGGSRSGDETGGEKRREHCGCLYRGQ